MSKREAVLLDPQVMELLQNHYVTLNEGRMSLLDAVLYENSDHPSEALAIKLHNVLRYSSVTVAQKQEMFSFIEYKFHCFECQEFLPANDFDGKALYIWGHTDPPHVQLRSGPCNECQKVLSENIMVSFTVCMPPECQE